MIKSSLLAVVSLLLIEASVPAQALNIDSCYSLAQKNYPLVKQYELIEKSKEYTLDNAGKAFLPQVSFNAIEGYVFGSAPGANDFKFIGLAQVNQTIWDGGATKTQKEIIKATSEVDKASVNVSLQELRSRVNQLYFGILLIDEQLNQLEIQDAILANNIDRVKQLNANGLAYKTDVDEMRVEQLKLNQQKKEFNYTRRGYLTMLSYLVGIKLDEQVKLEKPVGYNIAFDNSINRPELTLYENQRKLINAQSEMQHINLMPKIGLLAGGALLAPGLDLGKTKLSSLAVAGLSVSWNIGGLYKNSNENLLTQQQLLKLNVQEETWLFNTKFQMNQKNADIERQRAVMKDDDEIVTLRKSIREGYQLKYNTGAGPLIDLLNATEKEGDAHAQKALHEMQLLMTIYEFKTISGN